MTSSNGNIFRVTGPLCGEFTGPGEFPAQRPVTRSFDVLFDLRPNKRSSKQPWGWWFETLSWSLWRHCNVVPTHGIPLRLYARVNPDIIGSDNGLSPARLQAIIWTNSNLLSIGLVGTNFGETLTKSTHSQPRNFSWKCCLLNGDHFVRLWW